MVAPMTWIEAPVRQARPNTSLDVIPVHDVSANHFTGFLYQSDPCVFPNDVPVDCYITIGETAGSAKTFGDPAVDLVSEVFGLYSGIECYLNGGLDEFEAVAERVLRNGEYKGIDTVLQGMLGALSTATTPGAATSIAEVIGILEQTLAMNVPGQGYIYLSPYLATLAASEDLLIRNLDGTLETILSTPVVIIAAGGTALAQAYATGPINLWRTPIVVNQAPEQTINMGRALAERLYSLTIECGAWHTNLTAQTNNPPPPPPEPDEPLEMNLGSIPSSPIPDGTDTTIIVQTNVSPQNEVHLWYAVNGGTAVDAGEMTETGSHEFVWNVIGDSTTTGDSVEVWAVSEFDGGPVESNHIVIEVI